MTADEQLLDNIEKLSGQSSQLKSLSDRISDAQFLCFSWFREWKSQTKLESGQTFLNRLFNFIFYPRMRNTTRCLLHVLKRDERFRSFANKKIVNSSILKHQDFLIRLGLSRRQSEAVVSDEDATLVIAGAGSGKTRVISAKIQFLAEKGGYHPNDILAISFTRKSAEELRGRVPQISFRNSVTTFHKFGLDVLSKVEGKKPSLADHASGDKRDGAKVIESIVKHLQQADPQFLADYVDYMSYYADDTKEGWHFDSEAEYQDWLAGKNLRSLDGIPKKSLQECVIANWLIRNGVDFKYERPYESPTATVQHRQYMPDFWLPDPGVYLEHFGVDKDGRTAKHIDSSRYREDMDWKRQVHRKNGTTLLETYSWQFNDGSVFQVLKEELERRNCKFKPMPPGEVIRQMNELGIYGQLSEVIYRFLLLYKSNLGHLSEAADLGARNRLFLKLFRLILDEYERRNADSGKIDFEDMISRATEAIAAGKFACTFKYILVDEFQDISVGRARFLAAIRDRTPGCRLFAVGDDWQSIYRFTGADIGLMQNFESQFGPTRTVYLGETYRYSSKAAAVSTAFILKNPAQLSKEVVGQKEGRGPDVILCREREGKDMAWAIEQIAKGNPQPTTILVLDRYKSSNSDHHLGRWKRDHPHLDVSFSTVHAAKGLEADHVIINLSPGLRGFPCQITDDPVLGLVLTQPDKYPHGEERRLFYVALTRAKRKTFVISNEEKGEESVFALELRRMVTERFPIMLRPDPRKPQN